jgi:hypothetical protein
VAWLSLDEGDNDPARFWRHVAAALERARPGISGRAGPLLGPPPPQSYQGVVTALVNELADHPPAGQALLVLDDYHLISAQPVHAAVQFLLGHLPPGLRLVLATRSDPPLRLGRLRARGELTELRASVALLVAGGDRGQVDGGDGRGFQWVLRGGDGSLESGEPAADLADHHVAGGEAISEWTGSMFQVPTTYRESCA